MIEMDVFDEFGNLIGDLEVPGGDNTGCIVFLMIIVAIFFVPYQLYQGYQVKKQQEAMARTPGLHQFKDFQQVPAELGKMLPTATYASADYETVKISGNVYVIKKNGDYYNPWFSNEEKKQQFIDCNGESAYAFIDKGVDSYQINTDSLTNFVFYPFWWDNIKLPFEFDNTYGMDASYNFEPDGSLNAWYTIYHKDNPGKVLVSGKIYAIYIKYNSEFPKRFDSVEAVLFGSPQ